MEKYDHIAIEKKWQAAWEVAGLYRADENSNKSKKYILDMFPYPSGDCRLPPADRAIGAGIPPPRGRDA